MNDARISQFNAAGALSGEEYIPIAQLSDVTNTIRTVYTNPDAFKQFALDSISNVFCPVGSIGTYACKVSATDIPNGWLLCNGQSVSRTTYKELFDRIGTSYGCNSSGTFKLPDLKGRVVLGYCSSSSSISLSGVKGGAWNPSSKVYLGNIGGKFNYSLKSVEIPVKSTSVVLNKPVVIEPTAPIAAVAPISRPVYNMSPIYGGTTVSMNSLISGGLRTLYGGNIPSQVTLTYSFRQTCGFVTNKGIWQSLGCTGNNAAVNGSITVAPDISGDVLFKVSDESFGYQSLSISIEIPAIPAAPGTPGSIISTTLPIAKISESAVAASSFNVTQPYVVMNYIIKY